MVIKNILYICLSFNSSLVAAKSTLRTTRILVLMACIIPNSGDLVTCGFNRLTQFKGVSEMIDFSHRIFPQSRNYSWDIAQDKVFYD